MLNAYFDGDSCLSPTSLDVYLAAHILLVAEPPFPDTVLQVQLLESYPGLIEHAGRIQAEVARAPPYEHFTPSGSLLSSLVPRPFSNRNSRSEADPADIQYRRKSLLFITAWAAMAVAYCYTTFLAVDVSGEDSEGSSEDGEDEGGASEEGEGELSGGSEAFADEDEEQ